MYVWMCKWSISDFPNFFLSIFLLTGNPPVFLFSSFDLISSFFFLLVSTHLPFISSYLVSSSLGSPNHFYSHFFTFNLFHSSFSLLIEFFLVLSRFVSSVLNLSLPICFCLFNVILFLFISSFLVFSFLFLFYLASKTSFSCFCLFRFSLI